MAQRRGLILLNIGTPEPGGRTPEGRVLAPGVAQVREYLREFLMDPRVIDIPWLARWLLVNGVILRTRPSVSAELYGRIWTDRGSPLLVHAEDFAAKLRTALGPEWVVVNGMRYGKPSIQGALGELVSAGVGEVIALPMFPQYSEATTGSALAALEKARIRFAPKIPVRIVEPFFERTGFSDSFAEPISKAFGAGSWDAVLFSYHGLPERQIRKAATDPAHCLSEHCCSRLHERNSRCYRAQCLETSRLIARRAGIPDGQWHVSFQSRLGRTKWISPYTDELLSGLPGKGVKRLLVACPSFVADCLETLEEIGIRARETFIAAGGEELSLVPSLNASETWVCAVADWVSAPN